MFAICIKIINCTAANCPKEIKIQSYILVFDTKLVKKTGNKMSRFITDISNKNVKLN